MPTKQKGSPPKEKKATEYSWSKFVDSLFGKSVLDEVGEKKKKKKKKPQSSDYLRKRIKETEYEGNNEE